MKLFSLFAIAITILAAMHVTDAQVLTQMWYAKFNLLTINPTKEIDQAKMKNYMAVCSNVLYEPVQRTDDLIYGYFYWISNPVSMALSDCDRTKFTEAINGYFKVAEFNSAKKYEFSKCISSGEIVCNKEGGPEQCEACGNASAASAILALSFAAIFAFFSM